MVFEEKICSPKIIHNCSFSSLRPIAQRQIISLLRRRELSPHKDLYCFEIKKLIEFESKYHPNGE
jgi:hypothetical protein